MKPQVRTHNEMKFIGIDVRTSERMESDKSIAQMRSLHKKFVDEKIEATIPNRIDSDLYFAIYTKYERGHAGAYSYILASEVNDLTTVPDGMVALEIPKSQYLVFSTEGGTPEALANTWKQIRRYVANQAVYQRTYTADFEVYDKSFPDQVDVYIAVK